MEVLEVVIALEMKGGQWGIRDCDCMRNEGVVSGVLVITLFP